MNNILITGASDGLGRAIALEFGKRSPAKFLLISRNFNKLSNLKRQIEALGSIAHIFQCDVSKTDEFVSTLLESFKTLGKLDIAILNAGISHNMWILDENYPSILKEIFNTNVIAVGVGLHTIGNFMKSYGGVIAVVSSLADGRGYPSSSAYSSSKSAVTKITEAARIELKPYKVKIITIKPGFIRTNMTAKNKFPMPFLMDVGKAARIIVDGLLKGKSSIYFPFPMYIITKFINSLPNKLYEFFASKYKLPK